MNDALCFIHARDNVILTYLLNVIKAIELHPFLDFVSQMASVQKSISEFLPIGLWNRPERDLSFGDPLLGLL